MGAYRRVFTVHVLHPWFKSNSYVNTTVRKSRFNETYVFYFDYYLCIISCYNLNLDLDNVLTE